MALCANPKFTSAIAFFFLSESFVREIITVVLQLNEIFITNYSLIRLLWACWNSCYTIEEIASKSVWLIQSPHQNVTVSTPTWVKSLKSKPEKFRNPWGHKKLWRRQINKCVKYADRTNFKSKGAIYREFMSLILGFHSWMSMLWLKII